MSIVFNGFEMAGITGDRPDNIEPGQPYFNTSLAQQQVWDGTTWQALVTSSGTTFPITKTLEIANTIDILPATAGGSDLGSTTAEWGDIFCADSKALRLGSDQDAAIFHDGSNLVFDSNQAILFHIDSVGILAIDDSAITGFEAAESTPGLDIFIETQDAGPSTTGDTGQPGGAYSLKLGDASQGADTEDENGGDGPSFTFTAGGAGRAGLIASGTANGGDGGGFTFTASAGGNGGDASGNDGDGGSHALVVGAAGSGGGGTAGAAGVIRLSGTVALKQGAPGTVTTAATLTVAQMLSGIITGSDTDGSTVALTLPTGTAMDAALPADFVTNDSFDIVIINLSPDEVADTYTLTANTGSGDFTIVGPAIIASSHVDAESNAATFRCRKTASNTFVAYRIS